MKKAVTLTLAFILAITALVIPSSAAGKTENKTATIGGKTANLIYVTMDGSVTGELTIGSNSVNKDMTIANHVSKIKSETGKSLLASVNGGFFDSYYSPSKALIYPDNCAKTYAILIDGGKVIHGGGISPMIGFTSDGRVLIDEVTVSTSVQYRDNLSVHVWDVNTYTDNESAVLLFTSLMGYPVNIPSDSKMVYIKNNMITDITSGKVLTVPSDGTQVLVYNKAAWTAAINNFLEPQKGNNAHINTKVEANRPETNSSWSNVMTAVGCGPWLLQDGKDVTSKNSAFSDPKLAINKSQQRTFAAVMPDGRLVMGTVVASFRAITDYLLSIGATDALALDGGASSTLYMEGKGYLTPAGRKLSNVLHLVEYSSSTLPAPPKAPDFSTQDNWAILDISEAINKKIIPETFIPSYKTNITRSEFCDIIIELIKLSKGADKYSKLVYLTGVSYSEARARFVDTYNMSVLDCSRLKIIDGIGNNRFNPNGSLTRQQVAKILKNVADIVGVTASGSALEFTDSNKVASWATVGVDFVTRAGIMNGKGSTFDPDGFFTKQEAIVTIMRLYGKASQ